MRRTAATIAIQVLCVLAAASHAPRAQVPAGQAAPSGIRFHHVHLNSVNPAAAAEYYPKAFPTSVKTTFNGYDAVRTVNGAYLLFTKVDTPPPAQPQSAIWHFGWNTPDSRAYLTRFHELKFDVVPMYADPENTVVEISSDVLGTFPTTARLRELRSQGAQPPRVGGFQYLRGPDGALVENAGNYPPTEYFNHVHLFHEDPACAQLWYTTRLGLGGQGRGAPITADNCKRPYEEVTWPAFDKAGMVRNPAGTVPMNDMVSILIRPRHGPYVSPRGQVVDHFALSVPNLDATVARLKGEGVRVTEEIHPWGTMRAAMIEGPDRVAIELVELPSEAPPETKLRKSQAQPRSRAAVSGPRGARAAPLEQGGDRLFTFRLHVVAARQRWRPQTGERVGRRPAPPR
jgi:catechol 2,3-dioxygenase-like lactoylglutathione lyase family enzyme